MLDPTALYSHPVAGEPLTKRARTSPPPVTFPSLAAQPNGHSENAADDLPVFELDLDNLDLFTFEKAPGPPSPPRQKATSSPSMPTDDGTSFALPPSLPATISQIKHAGVLREEGGMMEWIKRHV